jgi:uncharacterized protein (DUF433 family)
MTEKLLLPGLDRITFDSQVMAGKACLRGMRITVALVLNLVANGMNTAEIIQAYPYLEPEDVQQALRYAAWLADEMVLPLTLSPA